MLMTELTLLAALSALFLSLVNALLIWWARQDMQKNLAANAQEQKAINLAAYGLAKHLRRLQSQFDKVPSMPREAPMLESVNLDKADKLVDNGIDSLRLSEELGVSQNEAEIIAHLRPRRRMLQKSA